MHKKNIEQLLKELNTTKDGLTKEEVSKRLNEFGENKLIEPKRQSFIQLFLSQFHDVLIYILLIAIVLTFIIGDYLSASIILAVVLINAIIGVVLENKASKAIENLQNIYTPRTLVIRDGEVIEVLSEELVIGDIVLLDEGRFVPADVRIIESHNLHVDESSLTGESLNVIKDANSLFEENTPLGDRLNMAYSSTFITKGRGLGIVVKTGMDTEIGKIALMLNEVKDEQTPLQKRLNQFGKLIGKYVLLLSLVVFLFYIIKDLIVFKKIVLDDLQSLFITIISFAVAAIPESILVIVAVVLAIGTTKLSKKNTIVKSLHAIETLGSVDVICSDKTGTLTENKMAVKEIYTYNNHKKIEEIKFLNEDDELLIKTFSFCNDAVSSNGAIIGDSTEVAFINLANDVGFPLKDKLIKEKRKAEIPFDNKFKLMTTIHSDGIFNNAYTKGAFDRILALSNYILISGKEEPLTEEIKEEIIEIANKMGDNALRVLGASYSRKKIDENYNKRIVFVGLMGLIDPPRKETKEAILKAQKAGIKVVMITGDHINTATAIANDLNILDNKYKSISGPDLDQLSDEELLAKINDYTVFARVTPTHKVRILKAFKDSGNTVAMTGDGVNDSPALKEADIGVAMGITGTDVAKSSADMILADDNFATIITAVDEGRNIYKNIKKSMVFLVSSNLGEILILILALLLGWNIPLIATQILWINLITDSLPAIALGIDIKDKNVMNEKPIDKDEPLITKENKRIIFVTGIVLALSALSVFMISMLANGVSFAEIKNIKDNTDVFKKASTLAFIVVAISQLIFSFSVRNNKDSLFKTGLLNNKWLLLSLVLGLTSMIFVVYFKPLQGAFGTYSISLVEWLIAILFSLLPTLVNEIIKFVKKNLNQNKVQV